MTEYSYNKRNLVAGLIGLAIAIPLAHWKYPDSPDWILFVVATISVLFVIYPLAKVSIDENTLQISYLSPLRKNLLLEHGQVETYVPLRVNRGKSNTLIMGILTPKAQKAHMLWKSGTKNFDELSSILEASYPAPDVGRDESSNCSKS